MTETQNSNGRNRTGIRGRLNSLRAGARNILHRVGDGINNSCRKFAAHCSAHDKTYGVLVPVLGAIMSLVTLILAIIGVLSISNFGAQRAALESIEFFTPKVIFNGGQVEYDPNKIKIFIHTKITNVGSLPVKGILKDVFVVRFDANKHGKYYFSDNVFIPYFNKDNTKNILIGSKSTLEWPISYQHAFREYNQEKPFYVCAIAKMNLETLLSADHNKELEELGLEYDPENLKHTNRTTQHLILQSHGIEGSPKYDNLFCQKNLEEIQKEYSDIACNYRKREEKHALKIHTEIKDNEPNLHKRWSSIKNLFTENDSSSSKQEESPEVSAFNPSYENGLSNSLDSSCEK